MLQDLFLENSENNDGKQCLKITFFTKFAGSNIGQEHKNALIDVAIYQSLTDKWKGKDPVDSC